MATIAGMFPRFPKKPSKGFVNLNHKTFEPRIEITAKYFDTLKDFDLSPELLITYSAYPFGGYVRDLYHNIQPKDLDLIIPHEEDLEAITQFLKSCGWESIDIESISEYDQKLAYRLKKNNYQIDLVHSSAVVRPTKLDFYANVFAIDFEKEEAFYWVKDFKVRSLHFLSLNQVLEAELELVSRPRIDTHAFNFLDQKLIIAHNKLRTIHASKIQRLLSNGWNLHVENFLTFTNLIKNTYKRFAEEFTKIPALKKQQIISKYLTDKEEIVREAARFIINHADDCPGSVFLDALKLTAKGKKLNPYRGIKA